MCPPLEVPHSKATFVQVQRAVDVFSLYLLIPHSQGREISTHGYLTAELRYLNPHEGRFQHITTRWEHEVIIPL